MQRTRGDLLSHHQTLAMSCDSQQTLRALGWSEALEEVRVGFRCVEECAGSVDAQQPPMELANVADFLMPELDVQDCPSGR